ncbi:hypothetical protein GCM10023149_26790 [Mucilaginibacter gynuensis]|uniref:DUF4271 domain-containing protein n=1 Tax=Mucilaginibacter gynuensis TaxID=1302236 RepID=A0ABP8GII8_9SPHI
MRLRVILFLLGILFCGGALAQDSVITEEPVYTDTVYRPKQLPFLDSVAQANRLQEKRISDSLALVFIQTPDPARKNQYVDSLLHSTNRNIWGIEETSEKAKRYLGIGHPRKHRDSWVIAVITGLLLYTAFLKLSLPKDVSKVFQSFYNKQILSQVDKENGLLSFWAFTGLFLLFSTTVGFLLYELSVYNEVYYSVSGFRLFTSITVAVLALFAVKFMILKFLGFIFDIGNLVDQYVTLLYFTYFNVAFVLLPVVVCLVLVSIHLVPVILLIALLASGAILVWLYLRNSVNIISNFRFPKFYLILYLCALEICPILVLLKALDI